MVAALVTVAFRKLIKVCEILGIHISCQYVQHTFRNKYAKPIIKQWTNMTKKRHDAFPVYADLCMYMFGSVHAISICICYIYIRIYIYIVNIHIDIYKIDYKWLQYTKAPLSPQGLLVQRSFALPIQHTLATVQHSTWLDCQIIPIVIKSAFESNNAIAPPGCPYAS